MFLIVPKVPEIQNGCKQVQSTLHFCTSKWIGKLRIIQFLESNGYFYDSKIMQTNVSELLNKLLLLDNRKYFSFCLFKKTAKITAKFVTSH
jgi:ribosomal protein S8